jgi:hypothetical protein
LEPQPRAAKSGTPITVRPRTSNRTPHCPDVWNGSDKYPVYVLCPGFPLALCADCVANRNCIIKGLALPTVGMVAVTFTSLLSFYPVLVSVIISLGLSSSLTTGYLLSILAYCLEDRASSRNLKYIRYICCVQDNRYTNVILDHCGPRHAKVNSSKNAPRIVKRQA